jgi:L-fucose isomerase-like protein
MRTGVIALGRPTFDVAAAAPWAESAFAAVARVADEVAGSAELAMDVDAVAAGAEGLGEIDVLVVLQATFTDGTLHAAAVHTHPDVPVVLWAFPEARTGDRLRLNSLCGINLGGFTLADRDLRWLYVSPEDERVDDELRTVLAGPPAPIAARALPPPDPADVARAEGLMSRLGEYRIGTIGDHPDGFGPCGFSDVELAATGDPVIDRVELADLFAAAGIPVESEVAALQRQVAARLSGLSSLDGGAVEASLRLHLGLRSLSSDRGWDAVATRCWPECFTEMGGAACAAQGMLDDSGIPATCERDVFGALTALVLQDAAGSSPFVADLVDLEFADDTAAVWHCGIAPLAIAHPDDVPAAAVHPNRNLPLLHQFRLRPGRVTIARFNRSRNGVRLTVGGGEILDRPRPFSGTSAVLRPDCGARALFDTLMSERLEHHYGIVHGDVRSVLVALADRLGLDVVVL